MCDMDILTLEDRPRGCLKVSGSNYPVAQCHIPKGWMPLMILAVSSLVLYLTEIVTISPLQALSVRKNFPAFT
jgi:hypothetical protein